MVEEKQVTDFLEKQSKNIVSLFGKIKMSIVIKEA